LAAAKIEENDMYMDLYRGLGWSLPLIKSMYHNTNGNVFVYIKKTQSKYTPPPQTYTHTIHIYVYVYNVYLLII